MSQINSNISNLNGTNSGQVAPPRSITDLSLTDFFNLMVAELQNQDPLDPSDNEQLLNQIAQIRQIGTNDVLVESLESLVSRQDLAASSTLIGKNVKAVNVLGDEVEGTIQRISLFTDPRTQERGLFAFVDDLPVSIEHIREVS
jgi:flagellar basal-body rod modification protein FlgD